MMDELDPIGFLKKQRFVIPSGWCLNSDVKVANIISALVTASGKTITLKEFNKLLERHDIH
jgi:hypothetical protein